jgi:predicted ATP-grasp superfamily ATP-dependent carboligase
MGKLRVLVTQCEMKHSLALIRHLARNGYDVFGQASIHSHDFPTLHSKYLSGLVRMNESAVDIYIEQMRSYLEKSFIDVLIPVGALTVKHVSSGIPELSKHVNLFLPRLDQIHRAEDKHSMSILARELGVGAPHSIHLDHSVNAADLAAQLGLPLVIKERSEGGIGVLGYPKTITELDIVLSQIKNWSTADVIAQEFVNGWGCGFFAVYQHGVCKRVFMHRRVRENPADGGPSCCAETFRDERLETSGRRILDALGWHGVAMVEFKYDIASSEFRLIEVNPKFWGSLELSLRAGSDFASDYVQAAVGNTLPFQRNYHDLRFQWPLDGDLMHATSSTAAAWAVFKDLLNPRVAKNIYLDDLGPTIGRIRQMFRHVGATRGHV